jgi:hypothetical protein
MFNKVKVAGVALAASAVIVTGAGFAATANAATTTQVTTNFTFPSSGTSATLNVVNGNTVPSNGTAVTFDLQKFVSDASSSYAPNNGVADTGTQLANDIQDNISILESTGQYIQVHNPANPSTTFTNTTTYVTGSIPQNDFSNVPTAVVPATSPATYNLSSTGDTSITLYVEDATANSFEVAPTAGGTPLTFTNVAAIDPSLASYVTWGSTATTPLPVVTNSRSYHYSGNPVHTVNRPYVYDGKVVSVNNSSAEVEWREGPGVTCEQVYISGYGFGTADGANPGTAHVGYTCDTGHPGVNYGYLWGLAPGHTYALQVIPATDTLRSLATPLPNAERGYVDVFTTN